MGQFTTMIKRLVLFVNGVQGSKEADGLRRKKPKARGRMKSKAREWTIVVRGDSLARSSWRWEVMGPEAESFSDDNLVIEKPAYVKLEKALDVAMECLGRVGDNPHISYGSSDGSVSELTHQYKIGVTDGHRLAKVWSDEALTKIKTILEAGE